MSNDRRKSRRHAGKGAAIELQYVMDEATFLDANHALWQWGRRQKRIRVRSWILLAALPITAFLALRWDMWFTFLAVIALALLHFVFDWPLSRAFARRTFARLPIANRPMHWRIGKDGLQVRIGEGEEAEEATLPWKSLVAVSEHDAGFILHQPHNVHHWLPRAAFGGEAQLQRFRQLLTAQLPDTAVMHRFTRAQN